MDSGTQDRLYETFVALAGTRSPVPGSLADAQEELAVSLTDAARAMETAGGTWERVPTAGAQGTTETASRAVASGATAGALTVDSIFSSLTSGILTTAGSSGANAKSVGETIVSTILGNVLGTIPAAAAAADGGGGGSTFERIATTVLKSGFGMAPLVGGLLSIFGGNDSPAPPALVKYALPQALRFEGADAPGGVSWTDSDQMGMPRAYGGAEIATSGARGASSAPPPQITVNVQAMDARSFMDRSSDIAAAVREAMLNLNPINDVVNDL
jgi:hypothetical protein